MVHVLNEYIIYPVNKCNFEVQTPSASAPVDPMGSPDLPAQQSERTITSRMRGRQ